MRIPFKQWIAFVLREYKAGRNPQKTVNLLKAVQWTRAAWESSVSRDTIKRCWVKSTLIKKIEDAIDIEDSTEDYIIVDDGTDRAELRDQIAQLPIESPLSLDEFLNPEDERIVDEDSNTFAAIVECYSVNKPGEKEELSSEEEEEEEVEQITDTEALRMVERLKLWKLQKGTDQDIKALDRIEREIIRVEGSAAHQTTICDFLSKNNKFPLNKNTCLIRIDSWLPIEFL